jgi:hypothetical protein
VVGHRDDQARYSVIVDNHVVDAKVAAACRLATLRATLAELRPMALSDCQYRLRPAATSLVSGAMPGARLR